MVKHKRRRCDLGTSFFEVLDLHKSFGGLKAIDGLSFSIKEGEFLSIIGPNGAGKTTVFNCISGHYLAEMGSISLKGRNLTRSQPHQVCAAGITRTFQNLQLLESLNVLENLLLGRHLHMRSGFFSDLLRFGKRTSIEEQEQRELARLMICEFGLEKFADKRVRELSYGVRKKVELARALLTEPELLLLDEPCAGMNEGERVALFERLLVICQNKGIAVLLIEHHIQVVMDFSDRILVMDSGAEVVTGLPKEILKNAEVKRVYLGI